MGNYHIHIEATGSHTNPKLYPDQELADRAEQDGSAEGVAVAAVQHLKAHGHTVHKAHILHHPGSEDERHEDLLASGIFD